MKIKCISNKGPYYYAIVHRRKGCTDGCCVLPFTVGKLYEAEEVFHQGKSIYYKLVNDEDEKHNYPKHSFIEMDEVRDEKLRELGI